MLATWADHETFVRVQLLQFARIIAWVERNPADIRRADHWLGRTLRSRSLSRVHIALYRMGCGVLLGPRSPWYRNVAANEIAYISTGPLTRVPATPRLLTKAESDIHLQRYATDHPQASRHLHAALRAAAGGEPEIVIADFTLQPEPV